MVGKVGTSSSGGKCKSNGVFRLGVERVRPKVVRLRVEVGVLHIDVQAARKLFWLRFSVFFMVNHLFVLIRSIVSVVLCPLVDLCLLACCLGFAKGGHGLFRQS